MKIKRCIIQTIMDAIIFVRPLLGPLGVCKFDPCCSQFARKALSTRPLLEAFLAIAKRLLLCSPLSAL